MDILNERPALDGHDFETIRQIYSEAQQWARHYEGMVVNTNVLIISASLIFVGLAIGDNVRTARHVVTLGVPILMSVVGLALTRTLFRLYAACVERMIRLENLLNCYDVGKFSDIDKGDAILPAWLMKLPVSKSAAVRFFEVMYAVLIPVYVLMMIIS